MNRTRQRREGGTQRVGEHTLAGVQREWLSAVTEVQEMNRHQPFSDNCYTRNNVFRGRERSIANVASKRHRLILVTKKNLWLSK